MKENYFSADNQEFIYRDFFSCYYSVLVYYKTARNMVNILSTYVKEL
jgi:hypothetical protein